MYSHLHTEDSRQAGSPAVPGFCLGLGRRAAEPGQKRDAPLTSNLPPTPLLTEIIGLSDRSLRRWRGRYEQFGYDGLFDRRPGRPLPRMLLHLDVSSHQWFHDDRSYELIEVLDDATSGTYWAQWVEEQSTRPVIAALPSSTDAHL